MWWAEEWTAFGDKAQKPSEQTYNTPTLHPHTYGDTMRTLVYAAAVLCICLGGGHGFYLPGVAPQDFVEGDEVCVPMDRSSKYLFPEWVIINKFKVAGGKGEDLQVVSGDYWCMIHRLLTYESARYVFLYSLLVSSTYIRANIKQACVTCYHILLQLRQPIRAHGAKVSKA